MTINERRRHLLEPQTSHLLEPQTSHLLEPQTSHLLEPQTSHLLEPQTSHLLEPQTSRDKQDFLACHASRVTRVLAFQVHCFLQDLVRCGNHPRIGLVTPLESNDLCELRGQIDVRQLQGATDQSATASLSGNPQ